MDKIYTKKYTYTVNNRDCYDDLAPWSILDLFQDIASEHIDNYGYGFDGLISKGLIWILVRTKYDVIKAPITSDKELIVTTWQAEKGRADFTRDYIISNTKGETLVIGSSKWCIIDFNTRRIAPTSVIDVDISYNQKNYQEPFMKLNFPSLLNNENKYCEQVSFSKLDHNGHLNNSKYAEIIMDAIKLTKDEKIKSLEINYLKEAFLGDNIIVKNQKEDKEIFIEGYKEDELIFKSKITLL